MSDVLVQHGIYVIDRRKREALAEALQLEEITVDDLDTLREYASLQTQDPQKQQGLFVQFLVVNHEWRRQAMVDLRTWKVSKLHAHQVAAQEATKAVEHDSGERIRQQDKERVLRFEAEYAAEQQRKLADAGLQTRLIMPWETNLAASPNDS